MYGFQGGSNIVSGRPGVFEEVETYLAGLRGWERRCELNSGQGFKGAEFLK